MIDIYARSLRTATGWTQEQTTANRRILLRDVPSTAQRRRKWLNPAKRHMKDPYDL
jgi:hypothetical protein